MEELKFNVVVDAKELVDVLSVASSIVNPKAGELVKRQVLFDGLSLTTFNECTVLLSNYNGVIKESNTSFCVDVFDLISIVGKFKGEINLYLEKGVLYIKSGKSKYKMALFPEEEFFENTNLSCSIESDTFKVDLKPLIDAINSVYSSASKDIEDLSGTYVAHEDGEDILACSNSSVGAIVKRPNLISFPEGVVPKFIIDFILKLKDIRSLEFKTRDGYFQGRAGNYTFIYRSREFDYPWSSIYDHMQRSELYENSFSFSVSDMNNALNRITTVTDSKTHAVKLSVGSGEIVISVDGPGLAGEEIVSILESNVSEDAPYEIMMDSVYLMSVLKEFEGIVKWSYENEESAQFITDGYLKKFCMGLEG